ncbi:MAG: uracil-DNA glycosylase, partial [Clostridia bacterium]|nr:uracil-DNA glycosylase [Clostridia bacterium]
MALSWEAIESAVASCNRCRLCEKRRHPAFGEGDPHATILFVGEGPGYEEDQQGRPFVGPAGRLLDRMLAACGMKRGEDIYIANVV